MKVKLVNEIGLKEIEKFLAEKHKLGKDYFDRPMLQAWACDAEYQMEQGDPPTIEIRSCDAVSGHTELFTISDEGIETGETGITIYL